MTGSPAGLLEQLPTRALGHWHRSEGDPWSREGLQNPCWSSLVKCGNGLDGLDGLRNFGLPGNTTPDVGVNVLLRKCRTSQPRPGILNPTTQNNIIYILYYIYYYIYIILYICVPQNPVVSHSLS